MSVKKNIIKNGVASIIQKGIKILEQLLLVPFFIKYWGAAYYGEWLTLTIIPSFISLSDFGFGSAAANTFLLKYAAGDKQGAANTAKTGFRVLSYMIAGAILLTVFIMCGLKYCGVFQKSLINADDALLSITILMISKILNFYQSLFEAYYRAVRRASLSINFLTGIAALNIFCGFIVLIRHGGVVQYAMVLLIISLITNVLYGFYASHTLDLRKTYKGVIIREEIEQILHKGIGYFLAPIWQAIYFQGSTFVVRIVLGPVAVTVFNTLRTLIRSSSQFFAMFITAVYPELQFELGAGNIEKAKKIFFHTLGINLLMALVMVLSLSVMGRWVYGIWTHQTLSVPWDVWLAFIASILFYSIWFTFSFIFEALNKPFQYTFASLVCAIISIVLTYFLVKYFSIRGLGWGTLSFDVLMCVYLIPKGAAEFKMKVKDIFKKTFEELMKYYHMIL